jgi:hypothetical protein
MFAITLEVNPRQLWAMLTPVRHHIFRESATTLGHKSFKLYGCLHHNIRLDEQNPFLYTILVIIRRD